MVKIKSILIKIYRNPLFDIFLLTFSGAMCCSALALRDWVGVLFTWYPVNLFIIYCFYRKEMSKGLQEILIFIISFLYLLYIWTPLTDGTVSDAIRKMHNPEISAGSEIIGSAISPVKVHTPHSYTGSLGNRISTSADIAKSRFINSVGTGAINGAGYTNENNLGYYAQNIGLSVGANIIGNQIGNWTFGSGNNMYRTGRTIMNSAVQTVPYGYNYFRKKYEDDKY